LRRQDLCTLGLIADCQGRTVPTIGGMILFGKDRLNYVPDAWIQVGYFASRDKTWLVSYRRETPLSVVGGPRSRVSPMDRLNFSCLQGITGRLPSY